MKAYTDLGQSKKLEEILPLESADMAWCNNSIRGVNYTDEYSANLYTVKEMKECFDEALNGWDKYWKLIPCWSLAALLDIIPNVSIEESITNGAKTKTWYCTSVPKNTEGFESSGCDTPIDACYEMISKLYEQNLL